jgi:hypothetical protein
MQAPIREYRSRRPLAVALVLFGVVVIGAGAMLASRTGMGETGSFLAGAACGVSALIAAVLLWRVSGRRLMAYPDWFHVIGPRGGFAARWDQIDGFYANPAAVTGTMPGRLAGRYEYRLVIGDRTLEIGLPVGADKELGDLIDAATRPVVRERAASRLMAGREVSFGPVTIAPDTIRVRGLRRRSVPLHTLERAELRGPRLVIASKDRRRPLRVPISRIPNARAVVDLIDRRDKWKPKPKDHRSGVSVQTLP